VSGCARMQGHIGLKEYEREREHVISSPQDMPDLAQAKQKDEND
jgi:hypothetical protein